MPFIGIITKSLIFRSLLLRYSLKCYPNADIVADNLRHFLVETVDQDSFPPTRAQDFFGKPMHFDHLSMKIRNHFESKQTGA